MSAAAGTPVDPGSGNPPPAPGPGPNPAPGGPTRPARRRPSRSAVFAGLAAALAVAAVVVLLFAGLVPALHPSPSGNTSATESEQSAAASAAPVLASRPGGPWNLVLAEGIDRTDAYSEPVSVLYGNTSCPLQNGTITTLSVPGYNGSYSNGGAEAWLLGYISTTGPLTGLIVFVTSGTAALVGEESGHGCDLGEFDHPLATGLIDSTTAATALGTSSAGSEFEAEYPQANATLGLIDFAFTGSGFREVPPYWEFEFDACKQFQEATLSGEVNASNGAVLEANIGYSSCAPSEIPIGSAFAAGNPVLAPCPTGSTYAAEGCTAGDWGYTLTVESSAVELGDVYFDLRTSAGANLTITSPGGFSVLNLSGHVIAQSAASLRLAMSGPFSSFAAGTGPTTPLTAGDTIVIDVGPSNPLGMGYQFVAGGRNGYTGTVALSLP